MAFDLSTARPAGQSGFDIRTARPVGETQMMGNPQLGTLEAGASLLSGGAAAIPAGLAGIVSTIFGGDGAEAVHDVANRLTYEPRTAIGQSMAKSAAKPFEWFDEKIGQAGAKVSDVTGNPALGAATKAGLGVAPMFLGRAVPPVQKGAGVLADFLAERRAPAARAAAPAMDVIDAAKANDIRLPPTAVNPSFINSLAESFAGKIKTEQKASIANAPRVQEAARRHGQVPEGEPITPEALDATRTKERANYDAVRNVGDVAIDPEYLAVRDGFSSRAKNAGQSFNVTDDMAAVANDMTPTNGASFNSSAAVDQVYLMRGKAKKAYRDGLTDLGRAYNDGARALEDQIGRHLEKTGADPSLVEHFRQARENMAKTFDVEENLTPGGNVDIVKLSKSGRPVSGEMGDLADVAREYPKAMRTPDKVGSVPMGSPLMHYAGVISDWLKGNKMAVASLGAQPLIRAGILSKPYQDLFVNHPASAGLIERIANSVAGDRGAVGGVKLPNPADWPPEFQPAPKGAIPYEKPDIAGMKAENLATGEAPKPVGNEIDFGARERAIEPASKVEAAQSKEAARQADAAHAVDFVYEDHPVIKAIADQLKLGESPKPKVGNEIDAEPFMRERAMAPAAAVPPLKPHIKPQPGKSIREQLDELKPQEAEATAPRAPRAPEERVVGQVYDTPKGKLKWTAGGWTEP